MKAYKVVLIESAEKELQKLPTKAIAKLVVLLLYSLRLCSIAALREFFGLK